MLISVNDDNLSGFDAVVLEFNSCPLGSGDIWNEETEFSVLLDITALFDGVRHMWFCQGDDGYANYPNVMELSKVMVKIRELEEKHCLENEDS